MKDLSLLLLLCLIPSILAQHFYSGYTTKKMFWATSLHSGPNTTRKDQADAQAQAMIIFKEVIMKNQSKIYNNNTKIIYEHDWITRIDEANRTKALENTKIFCKNDNITAMFYTPLGDIAQECLMYVDANCSGKLAMGANGHTTNWYLNKRSIFSIPPLTDERMFPILPFVKSLQKNGQKTKVALVYSNPHVFYTTICAGLMDPKVGKYYGYEVVFNQSVTYRNELNASNISRKEAEETAEKAHKSNATVLINCITDTFGIYFLKHIQKKKYDFDLITVTTTAPSYHQQQDLSYLDYVTWVDDYIPEIDKGSDQYFNNSKAFNTWFKKRFNNTIPNASVYRNLYAYITVMKALETSKSDNYAGLIDAMSRTDYQTIVGRLVYDSYHRTSIKPSVIQTLVSGSTIKTNVIGPPVFANAIPVLPIPKYSERIYDSSLSPEEYSFLAISLAFIAISFVLGIAIIAKRNHPIIRSAAPLFMLGIIVGSILIYIGSIFFRFHQLTTITCHLQVWFLALGFILMFGCLFAKSFRVWRLWNSNLAKPSKVISDQQLALVVGILTSIQLVLLVIYSAAGGVEKYVEQNDIHRPSLDKEYCSNNTTGFVVLILLVIYGFLLMIFGIFLAWTTRKVPFLAFNESKIVLFSMYNVAFFSLLALIVVLNSKEMNANAEFVLHTICILLSSFVTVTLSVGNKFYLILHGKTTKSKTQSLTKSKNDSNSEVMTGSLVPMIEFEALCQENEILKAKINKLQCKVGEFEE